MIVVDNYDGICKESARILIAKPVQQAPKQLRALIGTHAHADMIHYMQETPALRQGIVLGVRTVSDPSLVFSVAQKRACCMLSTCFRALAENLPSERNNPPSESCVMAYVPSPWLRQFRSVETAQTEKPTAALPHRKAAALYRSLMARHIQSSTLGEQYYRCWWSEKSLELLRYSYHRRSARQTRSQPSATSRQPLYLGRTADSGAPELGALLVDY